MANFVTEKGRILSIGVDTGATFGPQNLPLVRVTLEVPAHIATAIGFETNKDCKGLEIEIIFKTATRTKVDGTVRIENILFSSSEQVFQKKK
ncbi:hypothetical protein BG011_005803 [Mortierella polycephala]|uniref:Uncharacterized protein n=1 Tax=Mortierella polycephala TaxID=41804 RepID=A0A9P6PV57_9FUNG|nr:hypothetical protein BG011_005803 [Mortierella polycephala]